MSSTRTEAIVRIASVPANQIYIRHLEETEAPGVPEVLRLPDPRPTGGTRSVQAGWWPPAMLSADWVQANHQSFDLMHIHFGFDAADPGALQALVAALRRFGKPLVYTVHDLINPHQPDPAAHRELLDILVPAADKLITLTPGAAREIHARWRAEAQVLPHPHVVGFDSMDRIRSERRRAAELRHPGRPKRIGVHLKGLRPNMDPGILDPLARIVARLSGAVLQVNIHAQPLDPDSAEYQPGLAKKLLAGAAEGRWELQTHHYFSEQELFTYLASLDVCVLPHRFGTHSGWLEAALDVGTHVAAPDCGHYAHQHPSIAEFRMGPEGAEEDRLAEAVESLLHRPGLPGLDASARRAQRRELAAEHRRIYAALLRGC